MAVVEQTALSWKPWGYLATLAWGLLAFLVGQIIASAIPIAWVHGDLSSLGTIVNNGTVDTLVIFSWNTLATAIVFLAVHVRRATLKDYLALVLPRGRTAALSFAGAFLIVVANDLELYVRGDFGISAVTLQSYTTAAAAGWLPAMLAAVLFVAPTGEEVLFSGFLFRGWAHSKFSTSLAIVVIAIIHAGLNQQYDWKRILQFFVFYFFLGCVRWRSGSTLLTIALHAFWNAETILETVLLMHRS